MAPRRARAGRAPPAQSPATERASGAVGAALDDGLIRHNPCRIKDGGTEHSAERSVLTVAQAYALAEAVGLRYRALILLAAFTSLRWAELATLTPADIDRLPPRRAA